MRGVRFTLLFLAALSVAARAQELEKPVVKGNISIQLPKGWVAGGNGLLSAQVPQPDRDATGTFQASLQISQTAGNKLDGAAQQANVHRGIPGYQAVEKPSPFATASGLPGVTFGGAYKIGSIALRSRQYMFLVNGQIYTLTFTCLASRWAAYAPELEASVLTFNVKH